MKHFFKLSKREQLFDFLDVCLDCTTPEELESLLGDIFSGHEMTALSERWTIAKLLHMGFSYRTITEKTGASAATIARMSRLLMGGSGGLREACQRREGQYVTEEEEPDLPPYPLLCRAY